MEYFVLKFAISGNGGISEGNHEIIRGFPTNTNLRLKIQGPVVQSIVIQSNFNGSNTFGTMKFVRDRGSSSH